MTPVQPVHPHMQQVTHLHFVRYTLMPIGTLKSILRSNTFQNLVFNIELK